MPKLQGIAKSAILYIFIFSLFLFTFLVKAAPWLGFGTLPVKQLVNMTWAISEYNSRFYSVALTPSMIWLSSNPNNDYSIRSAIINYGWWNCNIDPYTTQKLLSWQSLWTLLQTTRFFLTCPRDTDVFTGNRYNPIIWDWSNSNPFRFVGELTTATNVKAKTCMDYFNIIAWNTNLIDGIYMIDPDWVWGNNPINVYCDMVTDWGGWTLVWYAWDRSNWFPRLDIAQWSYNALTRTWYASVTWAVNIAKLSTQMAVAFHTTTNIAWNMSSYNDSVAFYIPNPSIVTFSTSTMWTCQIVNARRLLPVGSTNKCVWNGVWIWYSATNCWESWHTPALWDQSLWVRRNWFWYWLEEKESNCDSFSNVHHKVYVGNNWYNWAPSNTRIYSSPTDWSASVWLK